MKNKPIQFDCKTFPRNHNISRFDSKTFQFDNKAPHFNHKTFQRDHKHLNANIKHHRSTITKTRRDHKTYYDSRYGFDENRL